MFFKKRKIFVFISILALTVQSCKKEVTTLTSTIVDTAQNIYKINVLSNPEPGRIYLSPSFPGNHVDGQIMIVDEKGHVIQQKTMNGTITNFECWKINGKTRYSYEVYNVNASVMPGIGYWPGYELITDSNFNEIRRVWLSAYNDVNTTQQPNIDGHDFILIDDNHYILESFYEKTVTNIPASLNPVAGGVKVISDVIQEVQNDRVVWQWEGTNDTTFYLASLEENKFNDTTTIFDYLHLNSMFIDPRDNNLICSFRNLDQVVKIQRGTGKILWRLGGTNGDFPLNDDQVFLRQHHATLTDSNQTLLLFDDGLALQRPYSRILEFNVNEINRSVVSFSSFNIPEPFTQYMGSVQKRGDTYFIGGGTANYVLEVNYRTGDKLLELQSGENFYRAYKY
ncbi:MAG: aryl-sulfate sulfotransferase [Taibaiella sp.]|nr:aryl-sulfate sulfotransferase [Taibaiella sp.]